MGWGLRLGLRGSMGLGKYEVGVSIRLGNMRWGKFGVGKNEMGKYGVREV